MPMGFFFMPDRIHSSFKVRALVAMKFLRHTERAKHPDQAIICGGGTLVWNCVYLGTLCDVVHSHQDVAVPLLRDGERARLACHSSFAEHRWSLGFD